MRVTTVHHASSWVCKCYPMIAAAVWLGGLYVHRVIWSRARRSCYVRLRGDRPRVRLVVRLSDHSRRWPAEQLYPNGGMLPVDIGDVEQLAFAVRAIRSCGESRGGVRRTPGSERVAGVPGAAMSPRLGGVSAAGSRQPTSTPPKSQPRGRRAAPRPTSTAGVDFKIHDD